MDQNPAPSLANGSEPDIPSCPAPAAQKSGAPSDKALSFAVFGLLAFAVCATGLLPAAIAGLALFTLGEWIGKKLTEKNIAHGAKSRAFGVAMAVGAAALALALAGAWAGAALSGEGPSQLANLIIASLDSLRDSLPAAIAENLPASGQQAAEAAKAWLAEHAGEMGKAGTHAAAGLAHMFLAMAAAGFGAVAATNGLPAGATGFQIELANRGKFLAAAFENVVFSQAKIAAISAALTALFLLAILPLFSWHVPQAGALVALSFACELIPVVGNLASNAAIALACFTVSPKLAFIALAYLALMHKAGYFISAKIVGDKIGAGNWELLLVMLLSEALLGLPGMIMGPVAYSWAKQELKAFKMIA